MLPPDSRTVLFDALRPPPGSELDRAVALTFTLDMDAALAVPLAFAAGGQRESDDPIRIMSAIRNCADRVDIFFQAGQLPAPRNSSDLYAFLEPVLHPVRAPRRGRLFHPKLWALRYLDRELDCYHARILVLSRNLTFDRSWDVCLRLEGTVGTRPIATSSPLRDLIIAAANLSVNPLTAVRRKAVVSLAEDLGTVSWERPEGVSDVTFYAPGIAGQRLPDFAGGRSLAISPFVTPDGLARVLAGAESSIVARQEELDRVPEHLLTGVNAFVLSEFADLPPLDEEPASPAGAPVLGRGALTGLHAKLYVSDNGATSRVLLGSANATSAAFDGNIELLVELVGRRRDLGVAATLAAESGIGGILEAYHRRDPVDTDAEAEALEALLRDLAAAPLIATVAGTAERGMHTLNVASTEKLPVPADVRVVAELMTRAGDAADLGPNARFDHRYGPLPTKEITPFVVFIATDSHGNSARAITCARLVGDPKDRLDIILAGQIDTPEKFRQFLALLLGLGSTPATPDPAKAGSGCGDWSFLGSPDIFELLVHTFADKPERLTGLDGLIERLSATEEGSRLMPDGFVQLWDAVRQARPSRRKSE